MGYLAHWVLQRPEITLIGEHLQAYSGFAVTPRRYTNRLHLERQLL